MLLYVYRGWHSVKVSNKNTWLHTIAVNISALGGTSFQNANCSGVNFTNATLKNTNFRKAILNNASFDGAKQLNLSVF